MLKCISVLILFAFGGCEATAEHHTAAPALLCSDSPDPATGDMGINRLGDQPIHQGRLSVAGGRLELRPCDTNEVYLLVGGLPIVDALYGYAATQVAAADAPIYIRFAGRELKCEGELPDRYTGVVRVTRIHAHESAVPPHCR